MKKDRIIIRPMYNTDPEFCKGMRVALWESTGEIIKKHFDNVGRLIPQELSDTHEIVLLRYDEINWELTKNAEIKLETIYKKYRNGDSITDPELNSSIKKLTTLTKLLMEMGETMHTSWKECNRVLSGLQDMKKARKEKK